MCKESSFCDVCTVYENIGILMDHKGVYADWFWHGGLSAGKRSYVSPLWTCEVCRHIRKNTHFWDSEYPKYICLGWFRLLLRQLELDSWMETNYLLLPQGKVCLMIMCTWCLWCAWRKLTIIRRRLFFEALGITVILIILNNSASKLKGTF